MPRPYFIEGYAIVSADCMIADADGTMDALKVDVDQQFFRASLEAAAAVVHGRHSAEDGGETACRQRLILTHRVTGLARDLRNGRALLWNPAGATFEDGRCALGAADGVLAVIGGANVFGLFLEIGYISPGLRKQPASAGQPHIIRAREMKSVWAMGAQENGSSRRVVFHDHLTIADV